MLRVKAVLRRLARAGPGGRAAAARSARITVDRAALAVTVDGAPVELTPIEYRLLLTLVERRGRVQSRPHLLEAVWQAQPDIQTRTVDMHVQRLRAKLGAAGEHDRDGARLRLPAAGAGGAGAAAVTLTRKLLVSYLVVVVTSGAVLVAGADRFLRQRLTREAGAELEREVAYLAAAAPVAAPSAAAGLDGRAARGEHRPAPHRDRQRRSRRRRLRLPRFRAGHAREPPLAARVPGGAARRTWGATSAAASRPAGGSSRWRCRSPAARCASRRRCRRWTSWSARRRAPS